MPADAREFDAEWARALLGEALRRFQHEEQHREESRAPFAGASVAEVLQKVEDCAPSPLHTVPRDLAAVCLKCIDRELAALGMEK